MALDRFEPPAPSTLRAQVLGGLAAQISTVHPGRRIVCAIDGVDGAGKTVLGRELTAYLGPLRPTQRASLDGFHQPRAQRYARGRTPETFFADSYDLSALRRRLLEPFRAGEPFALAVHDVETDRPHVISAPPADVDAILLLDGIFLHRDELLDQWDVSIWVDVPFEVSVRRGNARFGPLDEDAVDPDSVVNARYVGGQRLYLATCSPRERATWILDNTELGAPMVDDRGCRERFPPLTEPRNNRGISEQRRDQQV